VKQINVDKAEEHYQSALKVMALKPYMTAAGIVSMIDFIAESDPLVAKVKPEIGSITRSQKSRRQRLYRSTIEAITEIVLATLHHPLSLFCKRKYPRPHTCVLSMPLDLTAGGEPSCPDRVPAAGTAARR
jgi:hypothetical protein